MPPLSTWLIRHGESTANAGLPSVKNADAALTDRGIMQSRDAAIKIAQKPDLLAVSPLLRARASADFIRERWPAVTMETWPIHEFTYLSPIRCMGTTSEERRPLIRAYWEKCDPDHVDGEGAESFADFSKRLQDFHSRLLVLDLDFVVVVGHGQFFRAYSLALKHKISSSAEGMRFYRQSETSDPLGNGEVLKFSRAEVLQAGSAL